MDLPFVVHDGESDSWVCCVTNTVSLLSPNKASNARFIFPPCSLGTTSISHRTLNHIVSCRPCTSSTDIVALSGRFRFVDGIVNGLKSLRSFPISEVFGRDITQYKGLFVGSEDVLRLQTADNVTDHPVPVSATL